MKGLGNLGRSAALALSLLTANCANYVSGDSDAKQKDGFNYRDTDEMPDLNSADIKDDLGGNTDVEVIGHDVGDAAIEASDTGSDATPDADAVVPHDADVATEVEPDVTYDVDATSDAVPDSATDNGGDVDVDVDAKPADVTTDVVTTPDAVTDNGGVVEPFLNISVSPSAVAASFSAHTAVTPNQLPMIIPPGKAEKIYWDPEEVIAFINAKTREDAFFKLTGNKVVVQTFGQNFNCEVKFGTAVPSSPPTPVFLNDSFTVGSDKAELKCYGPNVDLKK